MIYQDAQPPPDQGSARYGQSYPVRNDPSDYSLPPPQGDVDYGYNVDGKPESYANPTSGYSANAYNQPFAFTVDTQSHNRRPSSASDTGSTTSLSHSQPSSATSSSVHLPLPADYPPHSYSRPATADGVLQDREGFSSAFGLMSLDDPDVIAGLSDGAPFFDGALINGGGSAPTASWGDGPTPRGNPGAGGEKDGQHSHQGSQNHPPAPTPSGLKELKDMWKQYMRTPLSGQPLAHEHHAGGSPKRERGLTRVASLPSVKTPSAASAAWGDPMRGAPQPQPQYAGVGPSYARTHNHPDDLRSYEQAVLARRAPLTLHLAPRRRGNTTSTAPVPSDKGVGSGSSGSPAGSDERASPAADSDGARPNFKRLPSQTLGPEYAKRPATGGMLSAAREEDISGGGGAHERARRMSFPAGGRPAVSGLHE
ncbi:hypothetical protein BC834DRAFT_137070 [Gloeopeniophorella convolvens]|nr:hypothetical protein BC834DRAFT_137070 [Gloeopeniophorella convolvens]